MTARAFAVLLLAAGPVLAQPARIEWGAPIERLGQGQAGEVLLLGADQALGRAILVEQGLRATAWRCFAKLVLATDEDPDHRAAAHRLLVRLDDGRASHADVRTAVQDLCQRVPVPGPGTTGPFAYWRAAAESIFGGEPGLEDAPTRDAPARERDLRVLLEERRGSQRPGSLAARLSAALLAYQRDTKLLEGLARQDPAHPLTAVATSGEWLKLRLGSAHALVTRALHEDLSRGPETDRRHSSASFLVVTAYSEAQLRALEAFHETAQRAADGLWASVIDLAPDLSRPPPALDVGHEAKVLRQVLDEARRSAAEGQPLPLSGEHALRLEQVLAQRAWPKAARPTLFEVQVPLRLGGETRWALGSAYR